MNELQTENVEVAAEEKRKSEIVVQLIQSLNSFSIELFDSSRIRERLESEYRMKREKTYRIVINW